MGEEEEQEEMLSITEAAERIGVPRNTIKSATRRQLLPSVKMHGIILIRASDLETYRQEMRPEGVPRRGRPRKQRPEGNGGQWGR